MKLKLITLILATLSFNFAYSQGFLDKFKKSSKPKEEPKKEETKELTPTDIANLDSASTFLDSKEIIKDSRGVSGIYYSKIPVHIYKGSGQTWVKKFLINYVKTDKLHDIFINTQYAYETTDVSKFAKKARFWMTDYEINIEKLGGFIATWEDDNVENNKYKFYTHMEEKDLQGNSIFGKDYLTSWTGAIIEAEPGIFFIGEIFADDTKSPKIERNKKYKVMNVLYRADKVAESAKYNTNDAVWDKLAEVMKKMNNAEKAKTSNSFEMLAPVTGFKNAPTKVDLTTAAQKFISSYQSSYKFEYAYAVSEWKNIYELIGENKQNTLVARSLKAAVISTKDGECGVAYVVMKQKNTFTTGSFTENFGTNPLVGKDASVVNTIDCVKANTYKK